LFSPVIEFGGLTGEPMPSSGDVDQLGFLVPTSGRNAWRSQASAVFRSRSIALIIFCLSPVNLPVPRQIKTPEKYWFGKHDEVIMKLK
jgi:hypothetical protein